jgi:hypothetical protein
MTHDEVEDFLAHYGKLGMKWGQRLRARDAAITTARKKTADVRSKYYDLKAKDDLYNKYGITSAKSAVNKQRLDSQIKTMSKYGKDIDVAGKMKSGEIVVTSILAGAAGAAYIYLNK